MFYKHTAWKLCEMDTLQKAIKLTSINKHALKRLNVQTINFIRDECLGKKAKKAKRKDIFQNNENPRKTKTSSKIKQLNT